MTEVMTHRGAGVALLDHVDLLMDRGDVAAGMRALFVGLDRVRANCNPAAWRKFAEETAIAHPLCDKIHQDPMTQRSFDKPRGYAGDAVLLDYLYGLRSRADATDLGRRIGDMSANRGPAAAVRHRRDLIAYRIDQIAERHPAKARVLSVACGHFREGRHSVAVQTGNLEEVVALDSDPESLREVRKGSPACVSTCEMSVRRLLGRKTDLGEFDFVYTAGLYDYLEDRVATALTARLFSMLRPGGRLLYCNFLPDTPDIGYMETFMGWKLIYRGLGAIVGLGADVPEREVAAVRRYQDGFGSVGYVELVKAKE